ncbi:MAG: CHRD domain-containing protein [Gemmatimonadetes bacterium]|nr:CHRD domain-containing protein [Gemmatimonadota bacterium]
MSRRYPFWFVLLLGGLLVAACAREEEEEAAVEAEETATEAPPGVQPLLTTQFEPGASARGEPVAGTATLTSSITEPGALELAVEITGLSEGEHAWHIHSGVCGTEGPVVVALSGTKDMAGITGFLAAGADETARATAVLPPTALTLAQIQSGQYSLYVHERGGLDFGGTATCANLGAAAGAQPKTLTPEATQPGTTTPADKTTPGTAQPGAATQPEKKPRTPRKY